jgi:hypothetical protein
VGLLVGVGADVTQSTVSAARVVKALDVGEHFHFQLVPAGPCASVDQLGLEGGEELLGHGVVVAVGDQTHRREDAAGTRGPAELERRVLGSAIGMVNELLTG